MHQELGREKSKSSSLHVRVRVSVLRHVCAHQLHCTTFTCLSQHHISTSLFYAPEIPERVINRRNYRMACHSNRYYVSTDGEINQPMNRFNCNC